VSTVAGARGKLAETRFFLGFLKRIEDNQPATTELLDNEATYFTSALLNACYSVLEHLECQGKRALRSIDTPEAKLCESDLEKAVRHLEDSDICRPVRRGAPLERAGLRTLAVHHELVQGKHQNQTHGGWGSARWGTTRWGATTSTCRLYADHPISKERVWIVPRMTEHVQELEELVTHWENRIVSLGIPGGAAPLGRS